MRPAGADTFTAVSSSSALLPTSLGTYQFPTRVPIQKNDYIGLTQTPGNTIWLDCEGCAGALDFFPGQFADGQTRTSSPNNTLVTINADVEPDADHDGFGDKTQDQCPVDASAQSVCQFSFGRVKKNRKKGTATLRVTVPGPGTLSLSGKGVVKQRPTGAFSASASRAVSAARTVKLLIKAKGKGKRKLNRTGKAKAKVKVSFHAGRRPLKHASEEGNAPQAWLGSAPSCCRFPKKSWRKSGRNATANMPICREKA